jgi:hypothetical protein
MLIIERIKESLKRQDWTAVSLELVIVIIGVFIGTQVSNWNQERIDRRETARMLQELRPALETFANFFDTAKPYYATTRAYSDTAFAGWNRDPSVSDEQFVVAAYQASQINALRVNAENWATIFGGERLRDIDDVEVRRGLSNLMTFDYSQVSVATVSTPYRQHVREVIPVDIQDAIRADCTDKPIAGKPLATFLPAKCDVELPAARFAAGAEALRAQPQLVSELRWHRAAIAAFMNNVRVMDGYTRQLLRALEKSAD